jgi:ATP-binding cassette subfamily B protein
VGAPFIYIVWATINGIYTLGDLALYAGTVFQARRSLYVLIGNIAELHNAALGTMPIFQLLNLQASIQHVSMPETNIGMDSGIAINDLSFSYPNTARCSSAHG